LLAVKVHRRAALITRLQTRLESTSVDWQANFWLVQGNAQAARHAARLMALQQGAMTGAKAQLAKESAEFLYRAGFLSDEAEE